VLELSARQSKLWKRELSVPLAEAGIIVGQVEDCTKPSWKSSPSGSSTRCPRS
jgi:hypothetical protein